jgi:alcohol dehydrogenase class IV
VKEFGFSFSTAGRIIFGRESLLEIGLIAHEYGTQALIVTGSNPGRADRLVDILRTAGVHSSILSLTGEPTVKGVEEGAQQALAAGAHLVVGFGGGSALDAGKAISALVTNGGDPRPFLEVIGEGQAIRNQPLPYLAVPTTAGTGTEVTRNAVLASHEHRVKVSLRSRLMIPPVAVIDPTLTLSVPPAVTAYTGLDALTQLIEPFISKRRNPMTDSFCRTGICFAAQALPGAFRDGQDLQAREQMALASLMSGMALANAGLGAVHGFAGPFGGMYPAPHGAICAAILPHAMRVNLEALRSRGGEPDLIDRFDELGGLLTGQPGATAEAGIAWLEGIVQELHIPGLDQYGLHEAEIPDVLEKASLSSSMRGNPVALSKEQLEQILDASR